MSSPASSVHTIDHIGWDLWRASHVWKRNFTQGMVARGHAWFAEARGQLIQHIGPNGTPQVRLVELTGLTKQAVQQQLDDLVRDGIVARVRDPKDARRKTVCFTVQGQAVLEDIRTVKIAIEEDFAHRLGPDHMSALKQALALINDNAA